MRGNAESPREAVAVGAARTGVEELFRDEYEAMYRLAYTMLGTDSDADEVVQDAFLGVAARWDALDNPGGYLRVSVVNGARKRMRSQSSRTKAETTMRADVTTIPLAEGDYLLDVVDGLPAELPDSRGPVLGQPGEAADIQLLPETQAGEPDARSRRPWSFVLAGAAAAAAILAVVLVLTLGDDPTPGRISTDTEAPERTDDNEGPDPEASIQPSEDESSTDVDPDVVVFDDFDSSQVWMEIEGPPLPPVVNLSSSGGVFYMIGGEPSDPPASVNIVTSGTYFATSLDGVEWTTHEMPDGLWRTTGFAASADMWAILAAGPDPHAPERLFISDDRGEAWTELHVDLTAPPPPSPYLEASTGISDFGVVGTTVVVMAGTEFHSDSGTNSEEDERSTGEISLLTSLDGEPLRATETGTTSSASSGLRESVPTLHVADSFALLFWPDDPQFASPELPYAELVLLTSTDGVAWTKRDTTGLRTSHALDRRTYRLPVAGPDGLWVSAIDFEDPAGGTLFVQHSSDGVGWQDIATFPGLGGWYGEHGLVGGPAGLVASIGAAAGPTSFETTPVIGWTVDGLNWQWQRTQDAFGFDVVSPDLVVDGTSPYLQLAVGTDVAIAFVESDNQPPRWFTTLS